MSYPYSYFLLHTFQSLDTSCPVIHFSLSIHHRWTLTIGRPPCARGCLWTTCHQWWVPHCQRSCVWRRSKSHFVPCSGGPPSAPYDAAQVLREQMMKGTLRYKIKNQHMWKEQSWRKMGQKKKLTKSGAAYSSRIGLYNSAQFHPGLSLSWKDVSLSKATLRSRGRPWSCWEPEDICWTHSIPLGNRFFLEGALRGYLCACTASTHVNTHTHTHRNKPQGLTASSIVSLECSNWPHSLSLTSSVLTFKLWGF